MTADCLASTPAARCQVSFTGMPSSLALPLAFKAPSSTVKSISPSEMSIPGRASFNAVLEMRAEASTMTRDFGTSLISGSDSFTLTLALP